VSLNAEGYQSPLERERTKFGFCQPLIFRAGWGPYQPSCFKS